MNNLCCKTLVAMLAFCSQTFAQESSGGKPVVDAKVIRDNSYLTGFQAVSDLSELGVKIDAEAFIEGLEKGIQGDDVRYDSATIEAAQQFSQKQSEKYFSDLADSTREAEAPLFAEKTAGMTKHASGLFYRVIKAGDGPKAKDEDVVVVNYEAKLLDGTPVDISFDLPHPVRIAISDGLMEGLKAGLLLMKAGATHELLIPNQLAYGNESEGDIGPGAAIWIKVHLVEIPKIQ